jgi:hypothetical protein
MLQSKASSIFPRPWCELHSSLRQLFFFSVLNITLLHLLFIIVLSFLGVASCRLREFGAVATSAVRYRRVLILSGVAKAEQLANKPCSSRRQASVQIARRQKHSPTNVPTPLEMKAIAAAVIIAGSVTPVPEAALAA